MPIFRVEDSNGLVSNHLCSDAEVAVCLHQVHHGITDNVYCNITISDAEPCSSNKCIKFLKFMKKEEDLFG